MQLTAERSDLDLRSVGESHPERVAIWVEGRSYNYAELAKKVEEQLRSWPESPFVLGLRCEPTLKSLVQFYAALARGTPTFLVHPRWTEQQVRDRLEQVGARYYCTPDSLVRLEPAEACVPHPPAALLFSTTGSSGKAKIVQHSAASLIAAAKASASRLEWQAHDRWLLSLPFAHIGGASVLVRCLLARVPVLVAQGSFRDRAYLERVDSLGATLYSLVPTQLHDLVEAQERGSGRPALPGRLRLVLVGGAPAALRLRQAAHRAGIPALYSYGMTEAGSQVATQRPEQLTLFPTECDVGVPLPGVDLEIDESQQIRIRGPNLMLGYLGEEPTARPEPAYQAGEWFVTRDRGELLPDGRLRILGRSDHVLISGGENVDPEAVESVLLDCQGVEQLAILAVFDERWGQKVVALVVPAPDHSAAELRDVLAAHARQSLESYAIPREYRFVDELPTLGIGKLDRSRLSEIFSGASAGPLETKR